MTAQNLSIHCSDVSFGFSPKALILEDLNLFVRRGERVAVMGGSGSGKTTLLKLVAGFKGYRATSGSCLCTGRFAMVFQQPLLLDHMLVQENILLPALIQKAHQPIDEVVRILGLGKLLDRYPFQLSGGQQRRVALARALSYPDAHGLIMDEPFTGLDEPLRDQILAELQVALDKTGFTCLFSTHNPVEAAFLADRIVFIGGDVATIYAEHIVQLKRKDRSLFFDQPEFLNELAIIRRYLSRDYHREIKGGTFLGASN